MLTFYIVVGAALATAAYVLKYAVSAWIKYRNKTMPFPASFYKELEQFVPTTEKSFVIVVPSFNNKDWYKKNLDSICTQQYSNYRVMYIDDASTDGTAALVEAYIAERGYTHVTLIKNQNNKGALANLYHAVHACNDDDIIVTIDGDDWLTRNDVLTLLNKVYTRNPDVWLTYGQIQNYPEDKTFVCQPLPMRIIKNNAYRSYRYRTTHLRTFYAWLFKKIRYEDLQYKGDFFKVTGDLAFMFPMIEMAGFHSQFIPDKLYVYNEANAINDYKVRKKLQKICAKMIRSGIRYEPLQSSPIDTLATQQKQRILLLNICDVFGGGAVHIINQYKALLKRKHNVSLLVPQKSKIASALDANNLSYDTTRAFSKPGLKIFDHILLFMDLYALCKKKNITIIHCNLTRELWACKMVAKLLCVRLIHTKHKTVTSKPSGCRGIDGIIGVSRIVVDALKNYNERYNLGFRHVAMILPFFDEAKFLTFTSDLSRQDFFKTTYNITLKNVPIICTIACFNTDKNQRILLQALHNLVYQKHIPAELILVGDGRRKDELKKMVLDLKLEGYVHFLGFTEQTPALLFHSDIHVLPSKREALGIANLEAMLMKKPVVGASKTGAETIIVHEKNGLIFENDNSDDLAVQLERLLSNPAWAQELGLNAYNFIKNNCLEEQKIVQLEQFYDRISA